MLARIARGLAVLALFVLSWFWVADGVDWVQAWIFLGAFVLYVGVLTWHLSRVDPALLRERGQRAENVEAWDRVVIGVYLVLLLALLVVSALDAGRFRWSTVPIWAQGLGWAMLCAAGAVVWHVMGVNAYLSSYVRIQEDRGQVVVREGLYRHVRHPMYAGILLAFLGIPLALGSWWATIPGVLIDALFVYRTAREDLTLRQELAGYQEYAAEVPYRLIPGIW